MADTEMRGKLLDLSGKTVGVSLTVLAGVALLIVELMSQVSARDLERAHNRAAIQQQELRVTTLDGRLNGRIGEVMIAIKEMATGFDRRLDGAQESGAVALARQADRLQALELREIQRQQDQALLIERTNHWTKQLADVDRKLDRLTEAMIGPPPARRAQE